MTRSLLVVALLLLLPPGVKAQGGAVADMKLMAPNVGWAERGGRLYWTSDNGANWKDITPPGDGTFGGIFFLDAEKGWMTINHDRDRSGDRTFDVVSTDDAGATWSRTTFHLRPKDYGITIDDPLDLGGSGAGKIVFADPLHGWMNVWFDGQTMNTWWSFLLLTSDGGRTWKRATGTPQLRNPEMLLVTPGEGWLYGTQFASVGALYVTRDGARSWQEVAPELPAVDESLVIGLPAFEDSRHGFLQVSGIRGAGPQLKGTLALLATSDGGRTWKPDRSVANLDEVTREQYESPTVVGSDWIFAAAAGHQPVLTKLGPGDRIDAGTDTAALRPRYKDITQISFATPTQGWAIAGGDLVSTSDGGATWTTLTPGPQPHVIQPHGKSIPRPAS